MSHFFVIIQRGQKLVTPAIKGITPKKNQALPVKKPVATKATPTAILIGPQAALIFIIFIISPNVLVLELYEKYINIGIDYKINYFA